MREVLDANRDAIEASDVLSREGLAADGYYLVSAHREENVDDPERLDALLDSLGALAKTSGLPVLVSTHPRTRKRLDALESVPDGVSFHAPFGFHDYVHLQTRARAVLSDSGTISEESSILGFPAISLREAIERPEALDSGATITTGVTRDRVLSGVEVAVAQFRADGQPSLPAGYEVADTSRRVVNFIRSTSASHHDRAGIRRRPGR
jgi:UDP-N-acetylglucosamine 2-epimerase (non-hydrolysing)